MTAHFFQAVTTCAECGEKPDSDKHTRRCSSIVSDHHPGFGFCRLGADHAEPHEYTWWNGEVTRWNKDGTTDVLEEPTPFQVGSGS